MKFLGKFDTSEETLYVLQEGQDIYICSNNDLDFPVNLGYDDAVEEIDYDEIIKNLKPNDKVELRGWYLVLSKKEFRKLFKIIPK